MSSHGSFHQSSTVGSVPLSVPQIAGVGRVIHVQVTIICIIYVVDKYVNIQKAPSEVSLILLTI